MFAAAWLDTTLYVGSWILVGTLIILGLVGTALPVIPGPLLIFLGAVAHRLFIHADNSIGLAGFIILTILLLITFVIDFLSGMVGAKYFGASRWGLVGALIGGILGIFFGIPGLIVGPIVGAVGGEIIFAKKKFSDASKSGWGTILGGVAGIVGKVVVSVWMVGWILLDILLIGP